MPRPVTAAAAALVSRLASGGLVSQVWGRSPAAGCTSGSTLRRQQAPFRNTGWHFARHFSGADDGGSNANEGGGKSADDKPVKRKKLSKKERFGRYDEEFDDEMAQVPIDETIEHLYDARPIFEEWMGHPTFYDMISADAYPKKGAPNDDPPGEGPILRWQTRVVLSPGGEAFHPKNRKVKVSVYVKELELSPAQRERLLFMVGARYNPNKDELTIVSERTLCIIGEDLFTVLLKNCFSAHKVASVASPIFKGYEFQYNSFINIEADLTTPGGNSGDGELKPACEALRHIRHVDLGQLGFENYGDIHTLNFGKLVRQVRYDQREENRKDVLRILLSLIEEAKKEGESVSSAMTT